MNLISTAFSRLTTRDPEEGPEKFPVRVKALAERDRRRLLMHFLALNESDRLLRFGTVLPDVGVTYYDVPQQYSATPYRYTVVNDRTVLVNPRTRRIMQVVE